MKKQFTFNFVKTLLGLFAIIASISSLFSQGASPWCAGDHSYGWQYSSSAYIVHPEQIRFKVGAQTVFNLPGSGYRASGSCGSEYRLANSTSQAFDITAGNTYTVETSSSSTYNYGGIWGIYIDFNNDKDFIDAGEYLGTWNTTSGYNAPGNLNSFNFTIPCNVTSAATRIRVVCEYQYNTVNASKGCHTCTGYQYYYGATTDFSINLVLPTSVSANFIAPSQAFTKQVLTFINSNQAGYTEHAWDANNDGSWEQRGITPNYSNSQFLWSTAGTKCVKLRSTNCLGRDSVVKCFNVVAPTAVPVADFVASTVVVEQYNSVKFFDLSTNGPWQWEWDIYDSSTYINDPMMGVNGVVGLLSGDVYGFNFGEEFLQNPEFFFDLPGKYTVTLRSTNDVGPSAVKVKRFYIECVQPTQYNLGFGTYGPNADNIVGSATGTIFDNGGPNLNYGNNQGLGTRSFLRITPCNALKINLTMTRLKFKDAGDRLKVYDGQNANGTLLGDWSVNDKAEKKVTANSGSMYIIFTSDAAGVDSGFAGFYTSELGPATVPTPTFTTSTTPGYNGVPLMFTNTTQNIPGVATYEWTIDGATQGVFNKKDYKTTFYTSQNYDVCLEVKTCVGSNKSCQTVSVITPNTQTELDVLASNTRPEVNVNTVQLKPITDKANRFAWTIFPVTYTLMNPPANPSNSGAGFINYRTILGDSFPTPVLKFTAPGCYTITLKAWNALDSANTAKTVVKNKYICALDYCDPVSYILSSDVGINRVRVLDGTRELINNYSTSGDAQYTDYSADVQATLTYGKTYTVEMSRNTTVDPAGRKGWIDWNIDGDFDDAGEEIFMSAVDNSATYTATFTVPELSSSYEGLARMRVATNYNNSSNITPCGPITAGEYEDYGLMLVNDKMPPVITMLGMDTVRIEKCFPYTDAGATAFDLSEGDLTSKIVRTSDLDSCTEGIYTISYDVTDASGNKALTRTRTIIVVRDRTAPVLNINATSPVYVEAERANCSTPYVAPSATAMDNKDGNLTNAIIVTGSVDKCVLGSYNINYYVQDIAGNATSRDITVIVRDTRAPRIVPNGSEQVQINSVWIDQTSADDIVNPVSHDLNPQLTKDWGFNGPVNTLVKASYPVTYYAEDASGNMATPLTRTYVVDDYVPPTISLNTFDVVYHDVRTPYLSVPATVSDNYYPAQFLSVVQVSSTVNENVLGTYTETFQATDGSGNVSTKVRTVVVVDREKPSIWGPIIKGCVGETIWPMWEVSTFDNYYGPAILKPLVEIVNQNVNPWEEGIYTISYRVTDPSGNRSEVFTRMVQYTYWPNCVNSTIDVEDQTKVSNVNMYPNPSQGLVTIDLGGLLARNVSIEVYNAMGQKVYTANHAEASSSYSVDLSNQSSGVYTIKLVSEGQVITKQVIITE